ncbi:MAG: endo-alpha-N-acetylgalactosaminidase family protein, partial [Candidatus Sumerlaeota bacterium]|nr:endo-alpha-N-acetylgalactosaminidase family protein [Candidatus Sumerlaeota bacterium]
KPDAAPVPTHWAYVYTDKGTALLQSNIPVFPIDAQAFGAGGAANRVSLWNGEYYYRVKDEVMPPLECQVAFAGDENGDGRIDWMDGAAWLRARLPELPSTYDDAFVYKISCCRLPDERFPETLKNAPNPTVYTTFDQGLEIIKKLSNLTHGAKQIIYLVGWQHEGHDSRYPDLSVVNHWLGGKEKLLALMEEAKRYNAVVSLHVNCDAAYKDSPGWDPDIVCRGPDGELAQWETQHGQPAWHISHYKDVKKGSAQKRIDDLLAMLPIQSSIHYDAFRYTNESWEPDGHIDMTAEMLGVDKIVDYYAQRGITITIESFGANPGLAGKMRGSWHLSTEDEFFPFLLHRRWVGGGSKKPEDVAYGVSILAHFENATTPAEMCDQYYLWGLVSSFLRHREMTRVANEDGRLVVEYGKSCVAEYDKSAKEFRLTADGISVAKGDDRFVPVSDREILVYSKSGGAMDWRLPAAWVGKRVALAALTESGKQTASDVQTDAGGTIRFQANPQQPYLLTLSGE